MKSLNYNDVKELREKGYLVVDTRAQNDIADGYIAGSLGIPFEGNEAFILEQFVEKDRAMVIVGNNGDGEKRAGVLHGLGYKNIAGWLEGGITTEVADYDYIISISAEEITLDVKHDKNLILYDLRGKKDFEEARIENSLNKEAVEIVKLAPELKKSVTYYFMCDRGDLSLALITYLKMNGIHSLYHIAGGFEAVKDYPGVPLAHGKNK